MKKLILVLAVSLLSGCAQIIVINQQKWDTSTETLDLGKVSATTNVSPEKIAQYGDMLKEAINVIKEQLTKAPTK